MSAMVRQRKLARGKNLKYMTEDDLCAEIERDYLWLDYSKTVEDITATEGWSVQVVTELFSMMEGSLAKLIADGNPHARFKLPNFGPGVVGSVKKIMHHLRRVTERNIVPDHDLNFLIEFVLVNVPGAREAGITPGLTTNGRREMMLGVLNDLFSSGGATPNKVTAYREPVEINRDPACAIDMFGASELMASNSKTSRMCTPRERSYGLLWIKPEFGIEVISKGGGDEMWSEGIDSHVQAQKEAGHMHPYADPIQNTTELMFDGSRTMVIVDSVNDATKAMLLARMKKLGVANELQMVEIMRDEFKQFISKARKSYHKVMVVQLCADELYRDLTAIHHLVASEDFAYHQVAL